MDIVGYAKIKKAATTGQSAVDLNQFHGNICRVFEFTPSGDVLVIDNEATGLATFDKEDVECSFKCSVEGLVITPPDLDFIQKVEYSMKCLNRKGGYNDLLKNMVIHLSLSKGVFNDSILWQKQ